MAKTLLSLLGVQITRSWAEEELEADEIDSRQDLINQMGSVLTNMNLSSERREEIINAVAIDHINAADIMVDREDIIAVSTEHSLNENLTTIRSNPHTRFPLVGESLDDIVGTIYLSAFVQIEDDIEQGKSELRDIASPALTVDPDISVSDLIDTFQETDQELALVVDNDQTVGLITAMDAFESIAGELEDPFDSTQ